MYDEDDDVDVDIKISKKNAHVILKEPYRQGGMDLKCSKLIHTRRYKHVVADISYASNIG